MTKQSSNTGIDYKYDNIQKAKERTSQVRNTLAEKDQSTLTTFESDFQQPHFAEGGTREKRINRRESARKGMEEAGYAAKNISNFDTKAYGVGKFDNKDLQQLQAQGFADEQIKKHIASMGSNQFSEGFKHNSAFAGKHASSKLSGKDDISSIDVGRGYNRADIKRLQNAGYTDDQIRDDMVNRAEKFGVSSARFLDEGGRLDDWKNARGEKPSSPKGNNNNNNADVKSNYNTSTDIDDSFNTSFDRTFGDNQNTIGNDNKFYGNVNQGNQDFSVNIAGGRDGSMSNLGYGAASKAMMENSYNRDRATFSAGGEAAKYVDRSNEVMGTSDRINKLDQATDQNIDYFRRASDRATLGLYGDIWNMKAPSWKAPGELDPIEVTYNKD